MKNFPKTIKLIEDKIAYFESMIAKNSNNNCEKTQ